MIHIYYLLAIILASIIIFFCGKWYGEQRTIVEFQRSIPTLGEAVEYQNYRDILLSDCLKKLK